MECQRHFLHSYHSSLGQSTPHQSFATTLSPALLIHIGDYFSLGFKPQLTQQLWRIQFLEPLVYVSFLANCSVDGAFTTENNCKAALWNRNRSIRRARVPTKGKKGDLSNFWSAGRWMRLFRTSTTWNIDLCCSFGPSVTPHNPSVLLRAH